MSEFHALELLDGKRVSVASLPGEDPSEATRRWFEHASLPYERWAAAALGPLEELFAELVAEGRLPIAPYRAVPRSLIGGEELLTPGAQPEERFDPPRLLRMALHQQPLDEAWLSLLLTRPLPRADWARLAERVGAVLAATEPIARASEEPGRAEAVPPTADKTEPGVLGRLGLRQRGQPRLALEVQVTPQRLPLDELAEVKLQLHFRNEGDEPAELYPGLAQPEARSGWGGPRWTVAVEAAGFPQERVRLVELRTWYGPPGMPPAASFFAPFSREVKPGATLTHELTACWIPRARLPAESVHPAVLDPEEMDGLGGWPHLGRSAILVLGQTREAMQAAMAKSQDFLRGNVVLFLPPRGLFQVTLGYRHEPWMGFAPRQSWGLTARPCELLIDTPSP
ncbi:MAG: hypothetical protein JXB05_24625 [Myxococcaceae bacterium]|nr:hypothetical protein [Myxococcaceae bacterium]